MSLTLCFEIALTFLLAATLLYCIVLERRLAALRKGQSGLKSTIGELNDAIAAASSAMGALSATTSSTAEAIDARLTRARSAINDLRVLVASGERIVSRIDGVSRTRSHTGTGLASSGSQLPSIAIMQRLDALRGAR